MAKRKKPRGVQQMLLHPDQETKAVLEYLCEQSGKLYNMGVYFARQTFFKTGKLLTGKFDLIYEQSVGKSQIAQSLPSTPAQQTLLSVAEAFMCWYLGSLICQQNPRVCETGECQLPGTLMIKIGHVGLNRVKVNQEPLWQGLRRQSVKLSC